MKNTRKTSHWEIDEGEEEDEESDFENYDTSERGRYKPVHNNKNTEDELQIHTDGEITNSKKIENTVKNDHTETKTRRSNREPKQINKYGVNYTKKV